MLLINKSVSDYFNALNPPETCYWWSWPIRVHAARWGRGRLSLPNTTPVIGLLGWNFSLSVPSEEPTVSVTLAGCTYARCVMAPGYLTCPIPASFVTWRGVKPGGRCRPYWTVRWPSGRRARRSKMAVRLCLMHAQLLGPTTPLTVGFSSTCRSPQLAGGHVTGREPIKSLWCAPRRYFHQTLGTWVLRRCLRMSGVPTPLWGLAPDEHSVLMAAGGQIIKCWTTAAFVISPWVSSRVHNELHSANIYMEGRIMPPSRE